MFHASKYTEASKRVNLVALKMKTSMKNQLVGEHQTVNIVKHVYMLPRLKIYKYQYVYIDILFVHFCSHICGYISIFLILWVLLLSCR